MNSNNNQPARGHSFQCLWHIPYSPQNNQKGDRRSLGDMPRRPNSGGGNWAKFNSQPVGKDEGIVHIPSYSRSLMIISSSIQYYVSSHNAFPCPISMENPFESSSICMQQGTEKPEKMYTKNERYMKWWGCHHVNVGTLNPRDCRKLLVFVKGATMKQQSTVCWI